MAEITMDTDWGAKGAQLNGAQVQKFIKDQLRELQARDIELKRQIDNIVINGGSTEDYNAKIRELQGQITELQNLLETYSNIQSDWNATNKMAKNYIKNKPEVQTVEAKPGKRLKSYINSDGSTVNYKIGDIVRYKDADSSFIFYQVNDILSNGDVVWEESGTGGSMDLYEKVIISLSNNQNDVTDLIGKKITIISGGHKTELTWNGTPIVHKVLIQTKYSITVEAVNNYSTPLEQSFDSIGGYTRSVNFVYLCEKVTVTLSADNGADCTARTITVTNNDNGSVIGTVIGSTGVFKIPFGVTYKVSVNEMKDFTTPKEQTFTAYAATRDVALKYIYNPLKSGYYTINDTINDPATKITVTPEVTAILKWIRENSHRVLVKRTGDKACKVIRLHDTDGEKYHSGEVAPITNTVYDVMMMMPDFWYTVESGGTDIWKIWLADKDPKDGKDWHKWDHNHLIAVYHSSAQMIGSSNTLCSISGAPIASGIGGLSTFKLAYKFRGAGYHLLDWQSHCVMAILFYGYYQTTNSSHICGTNANEISNTGLTSVLGMKDTALAPQLQTPVNFWGLEGWWGMQYEWLDNIVIDSGVYKITDSTGQSRTAGTAVIPPTVDSAHSSGFVSKFTFTSHLDMIPKEYNGSSTSGYCDLYHFRNNGLAVLNPFRGGKTASDNKEGISFIGTEQEGELQNQLQIASRLAFEGTVTEVNTVSEFLA